MSEKDLKVIGNIEKEIAKIKNKENKIYFFVIDSKGAPSGSLEYIYNLALILKNEGYDVTMLHTEDEFVGVVNMLSSIIYPDDIKEYEKKHPEFIFLKAMDMFVEGDSEIIEKDDPFYKLVDDGFVKLNIDLLNNLL